MTTIAIEKDNPTLDKLAQMAIHESVIVTKESLPYLAVIRLTEDDIEDLQTWQLGSNPKFLEILKRSVERMESEGTIPLTDVERRLGLAL